MAWKRVLLSVAVVVGIAATFAVVILACACSASLGAATRWGSGRPKSSASVSWHRRLGDPPASE
jgi:hypothetical protein